MARLEGEAAAHARAQMESELAWVQRALAASDGTRRKAESDLKVVEQALLSYAEAGRKAEEEASHLAYERVSLLLEIGACKDVLVDFQAEVAKEKKAMEEEFDASGNVIFNYGYGCCAFAHDICGSKSRILDGIPDTTEPLPPEFFINPRFPLSTAPRALASDLYATTREERSSRVLPAPELVGAFNQSGSEE